MRISKPTIQAHKTKCAKYKIFKKNSCEFIKMRRYICPPSNSLDLSLPIQNHTSIGAI